VIGLLAESRALRGLLASDRGRPCLQAQVPLLNAGLRSPANINVEGGKASARMPGFP